MMASFMLFTKLPAELQDLIWECAILLRRPVAHLVQIKTTRWADGRLIAGKPTKTSFHHPPEDKAPVDHNGPIIAALLRTTTASRDVVRRLFRGKGLELAVLRPPPASPPSAPLVQINVSDDLVVLEAAWHLHADRNTPLAMDRARYMAFPAPNTPRNRVRLRGDFEALTSIYNLRVVYAVIEPDALREAAGVAWPEREAWETAGWNGGMDVTLDGFLSSYGDGGGPVGPFVRGGREYYEIPAEEVRKLGGLQWIIADMEAMRCTQQTLGRLAYDAEGARNKYWTRHRLMSWREVKTKS